MNTYSNVSVSHAPYVDIAPWVPWLRMNEWISVLYVSVATKTAITTTKQIPNHQQEGICIFSSLCSNNNNNRNRIEPKRIHSIIKSLPLLAMSWPPNIESQKEHNRMFHTTPPTITGSWHALSQISIFHLWNFHPLPPSPSTTPPPRPAPSEVITFSVYFLDTTAKLSPYSQVTSISCRTGGVMLLGIQHFCYYCRCYYLSYFWANFRMS